ncbi:ParB/RepB/Spo0J family partition protein [Hyphomicrobium facile]|uniref:Chromosome partitioning protein, ParB family n=1 Tax=Hyphomicrobium facile TaxID=51670 RepID=A0A1I7NSD8_9HYPH|nr:ParB/RepB/Spo0J family partition protein [Hyphomicrobium facile]SFV37591.1 chromosome partitioning protein, ParB family [Hyphomicrobium facile]
MNSVVPKSRLGRGLASLIGEPAPLGHRLPPEGEQRMVSIAEVKSSPLNPRKDFREDELAELAESIRTKGLVQPIVVRPNGMSGGYEIVAGERRWRAAQKAGMHNIPVIIRELTDREVLELAIIENVQRQDLNAIEEASGYRELVERFDYSQEQLSEIIGKSRSHVANTLRLLKLPTGVQSLVQQGQLTAGHARALIGRADAEALAKKIIDDSLNVRDVEALVQTFGEEGSTGGNRRARDKDADTKAFEKELTDLLGLKVEVRRGSGETGTLTIRYGNFDQLDYIRQRLGGG